MGSDKLKRSFNGLSPGDWWRLWLTLCRAAGCHPSGVRGHPSTMAIRPSSGASAGGEEQILPIHDRALGTSVMISSELSEVAVERGHSFGVIGEALSTRQRLARSGS